MEQVVADQGLVAADGGQAGDTAEVSVAIGRKLPCGGLFTLPFGPDAG